MAVRTRMPNRLRRVRERKLLTRRDLAWIATVSVRTITSVESGLACRPATKRKLLRALGIPVERASEVFPA